MEQNSLIDRLLELTLAIRHAAAVSSTVSGASGCRREDVWAARRSLAVCVIDVSVSASFGMRTPLLCCAPTAG